MFKKIIYILILNIKFSMETSIITMGNQINETFSRTKETQTNQTSITTNFSCSTQTIGTQTNQTFSRTIGNQINETSITTI